MTAGEPPPQQDAFVLALLFEAYHQAMQKIPASEWPALDSEAQATAIRTLIEAAERGERDIEVLKHLAWDCLSLTKREM